MILVEGYRAFRGKLLVVPKMSPAFHLEGDFLYNPESDCWYGCGRSFSSKICEVMVDET